MKARAATPWTRCGTSRLLAPALGLLLVSLLSALAQAPPNAAAPGTDDDPILFQNPPRPLQGGGGEVWSVALSPDGATLAVGTGGLGDNPGGLELWDVKQARSLARRKESKPIRSVAFSPDGKMLATGEFDDTAKLRDPATGAVRRVLRGHTGAVNSVAFTPDGKALVTGHDNQIVYVTPLPGTGP